MPLGIFCAHIEAGAPFVGSARAMSALSYRESRIFSEVSFTAVLFIGQPYRNELK
jgi:hypothetical protein